MRISSSMRATFALAGIALMVVWKMPGWKMPGWKSSPAPDLARLRQAFAHPPDDARILMRWWWFGAAVTKPELEAEMRQMKAAGIGGFEVQAVYPLTLDDPGRGIRNLPFLSPEFLDALGFTAGKAAELGLRMDLTLGSGWPYGGPQIPAGLGAGRLRCERVTVRPGDREIELPAAAPGESWVAAFLVQGKEVRRLPLPAGDGIPLSPPPGDHATALLFLSSHTGMTVKRAASGAEGLVLDHYNRAALERYLTTVGEPLLSGLAAHPPYAIFCDSLEVFGSDWTGAFLEQFRRRRGYDLTPYLPALATDIGPATGAIRNDWGATLTELAEEEFLAPLAGWARKHGTRLRLQAYGTPPVALASSRLVDLPEGEGSFWNRFTSTRWASSAGHLLGRNVISSETWTWLHSPAFRATPLDVKAEADRHFLQGINQLVGHGWPYSPPFAGDPGWRFYAASALNPHNPWWIAMPDLALYLQRLSFLLRQGQPVNDVALYLPVADARARTTLGQASLNDRLQEMFGASDVIPQILAAGYGFDFVDDAALQNSGAGNGNRYPLVILPGVERIPVETYRRLEAFVKAGGRLLAFGRVPALAPGFREAETQGAEVRAISHRLFSEPERELSGRLRQVLRPDLALSSAANQVGFVHRRTGSAEIYFLANTGNSPVRARATFRVQGMQPECWDPLTGRMAAAKVESAGTEGVTVAVEFAPYQSRVVVFSRHPVEGGSESASGQPPDPVDLSRQWDVSFAGSGPPRRQDHLRSWTEAPGTRFFSGQATYEKAISVSPGHLQRGLAWYLDFGEGTAVPEPAGEQRGMRAWLDSPVREAAVVYVNDRRAGAVWCPPYRVEVTPHLLPGENRIRIVVGNLAINRMAGSPLPDYGPLIQRYGKRFEPQDMHNLQALPSGLLGPVRLLPVASRVSSFHPPAGKPTGAEASTRPTERE